MATGGTVRSNLENVWRRTKVKPKELEQVEFQVIMGHVWSWFHDLRRSIGQGFSGPLPISYQDIYAWSAMTGNRPDPFEISCIVALDEVVTTQDTKDK